MLLKVVLSFRVLQYKKNNISSKGNKIETTKDIIRHKKMDTRHTWKTEKASNAKVNCHGKKSQFGGLSSSSSANHSKNMCFTNNSSYCINGTEMYRESMEKKISSMQVCTVRTFGSIFLADIRSVCQ